MIADPLRAARHQATLPIYCPACGYTATIATPGEATLHGIVERSHELEWNHERDMLLRLDALVRRFPDSLHRDKVRVTTSKAGPDNQYHLILDSRPTHTQPVITRRIEPDPEFDAALDADPELRDWMKGSSFLLYPRLSAFAEEADYSAEYAIDELKCPTCLRDYIAIDRAFFETLV
ncbi:hypothetical protein OKA05_27915 [Luteolibacter arcticus]|uniref:Uncharacterized protein n=1 Tax=Luteolibacter arcticus TaxID=1581411 RepID=A0ABT3GSB1_9BACT|nr:hypothetical protein [Luteolibacter arcticus]MCW1926410.1 hypothetical protein [Luteolibacter arcticus]